MCYAARQPMKALSLSVSPLVRATEKDFIGFAVLSIPLFPLKGEVSNHKGIFDEK